MAVFVFLSGNIAKSSSINQKTFKMGFRVKPLSIIKFLVATIKYNFVRIIQFEKRLIKIFLKLNCIKRRRGCIQNVIIYTLYNTCFNF